MKRTVCGCCEPGASPTPRQVENRPALSAIAYRIGTFASFREAMLEAIADAPELAGLTTRRSDDYSITFLELWAAVADVLTFYQERYANEAFLRTARFRDSVSRLTALLDYRLLPGVAARTWIAFTLDAGKKLLIPAGQKVQSVPEQGQQPQTFETLEPVAADARLNRLRVFPPPTPRSPLAAGSLGETLDRLLGPSLAAGLAPDQSVVLFNNGGTTPAEEKKVKTLRTVDDRVILEWKDPVQGSGWSAATRAFKFRRTFRLFGHNAPETYMQPSEPAPGRITWHLVSLGGFGLPASSTLQLDGKVEDLAVGQKLLVADTAAGGRKTLVTIQAISQVHASFGPLADAVTQLQVTPQVPDLGDRRKAVIYELQGTSLSFWDAQYPAQLTGDTLWLPGFKVVDSAGPGVEVGVTLERNAFKRGVVVRPDDLGKGRTVLIEDGRGEPVRALIKSAPVIEPLGALPTRPCHLVLSLAVDGTLDGLATASAVLLGNVAAASHGETVRGEVVGSGDAAARFQRLALKKKPLTWLPGTGPDGIASSLEVRVDGARWREVPVLFGQPPNAPVYELRTAEDGTAVLQFGDGTTGAPLPTGRGNVTATYRVGVGLAGRVAASALTTLLAKPTGLSAATNPFPAEGGADPETIDRARENAPRTVRTFGRAVSLRDFEDLVTASGEVAKACATWVWDGLDRAIHLTIAGQQGAQLSEDARRQLGVQLRSARDPNHRLRIDNYRKIPIELRAGIAVDPDQDRDAVLAAAREAALAALSFDALRLGQAVHLSDLYRVLQDVPGVLFVDVDRLIFKRPAGMTNLGFLLFLFSRGVTFLPGLEPAVQGHLRLFPARPDPAKPGHVLPAELATIESPTQDLIIEPREA